VRTIVWFRRDLRLADNPAIEAATADGEVVPLFVVDPAFDRAGAARRAFLAEALDSLDDSMGRALVYRHGDPATVVPAFAAEVGASSVIVAEDFGPYGRRRDDSVARCLAEDGRHLRRVGSPYVNRPGSVRKDDGTPYAVFSPYARRWVDRLLSSPPDPPLAATPSVRWVGAPQIHCDGPPMRPLVDSELPDARENVALALVEDFVTSGRLDCYAEQRDMPAVDGTSRLSAYVRWGIVHPRQIIARLGESKSHDVFRSELCWREFYADVLATRPQSAWNNLQPKMNSMLVDTDARARHRFAAWATGATGYPLVDAGMRQLAATGWMHNRVRMVVASFLVKDLHLPWQWGARHFMEHLVDGDLASNNHGWQWAAGTGTDAAPYFRIFNPTAQSQRFDADGDYIRTWIPELGQVSAKDIHAPSTSKRGVPLGYCAPVVDHATERDEALARFRRLGVNPHQPR
jgi:deoxyribodipyrimidine photo-lyase